MRYRSILLCFLLNFELSCLNSLSFAESLDMGRTTSKTITNGIKTYVMCVGVSKYKSRKLSNLKHPDNDAKAFAQLFEGRKNTEVKMLLNKDANKDSITYSIKQFFSKADKNDVVMLYYSGHGFEGGFCVYDFVYGEETGHLFYDEIAKLLSECNAFGKIVFADACHAGGLRTMKPVKSEKNSVQKHKQVVFCLSCRENQNSYENIFHKNGIFTTYLIKAFSGHADKNQNGKITVKETFDYLYNEVSRESGGAQTPNVWGNFKKNLILMDNSHLDVEDIPEEVY